MTTSTRETKGQRLLRLWVVAATWALIFGTGRMVADLLVPPHLTWWFSAAVSVVASLGTSFYWIHVHDRGGAVA